MSSLLSKTLKTLLVLLVPVVLILGAVRLLATDAYLAFEYGKSSFPPDAYGFTPQQRFDLASTNIHYVRAHLHDDTLSKQILNGTPVYNQREVMHMADVRAVFQVVFRVWQFAFILLLLLAAIFFQNGKRMAFASAMQVGGLITAAVIFAIGLFAVVAWQAWFDLFHQLLFVQGSWLFSYSDTLIRLFPIEFWFDAVLTLSVLAFIGGTLFAIIGWRGQTFLARRRADLMHVA